jgi:hypothetical protein
MNPLERLDLFGGFFWMGRIGKPEQEDYRRVRRGAAEGAESFGRIFLGREKKHKTR